ncbi:MAG: DUF4920 domain-containing protein [Winogradskyella sp.]|uniref:DUF4920 domain-containing protein n=1 Tax=Winogradskyella sp. TaxID=1883156 RepID=UPI0017B8B04B|nr:DUF4920 domain-containing protein [Winogradskyella sp.]
MKKIALFILTSTLIVACKNDIKVQDTPVEEEKKELAYTSIGMEISDDDALPSDRMMEHYKNLKPGDTIPAKMTAKIDEVCSKKGCWMTLDMGNENEVMVKFKDYGFFMPLDAEGEVVVNGKAFVAETPVDELRHYAEDAGKSKEEIEAITEPKLEYRFEADGVLLKGE